MNILDWMNAPEGYVSRHTDMPAQRQTQAKALCWEYNRTAPFEGEKRAKILGQLLGTCHPLTFIEPDFHCDYGFNIHAHGLTVINYNCVILDTSRVEIGAGTFIGPGCCLACSGHSLDASQRADGIGTSAPSRWAKMSGWAPMSPSAAVYPSAMEASSERAASSPGIFPPVWLPLVIPAKSCVPSPKLTA